MTQLPHNITRIFILICLLARIALAQDATDKVLNRIAGGERIKAEEISSEARPQVIVELKNFIKQKHQNDINRNAVRLLVALKDDETIRHLVSQYHSDFTKGGDILDFEANSEIIPFIAPDLSLPADFGKHLIGDVYIPPTRDWAARLILWCIVNSPEFPAKTQAWAHTDGRDDWSMANQWWVHNKDAVLAKRYQDATWLPPVTTPASK